MVFNYICCGPFRTRVDKASAVLALPSMFLNSIGIIFFYYFYFGPFPATTFIIILRFCLCLLILVYIVANVLTIVGYFKRISALYLPYLSVQIIIMLLIVIHWIVNILFAILIGGVIAFFGGAAVSSSSADADVAAAGTVIGIGIGIAILHFIINTVVSFACLAFTAFFFVVFYDAWRFIESEEGKSGNNNHLAHGGIDIAPPIMDVTQPKI